MGQKYIFKSLFSSFLGHFSAGVFLLGVRFLHKSAPPLICGPLCVLEKKPKTKLKVVGLGRSAFRFSV